jgi:hypothetical protein
MGGERPALHLEPSGFAKIRMPGCPARASTNLEAPDEALPPAPGLGELRPGAGRRSLERQELAHPRAGPGCEYEEAADARRPGRGE